MMTCYIVEHHLLVQVSRLRCAMGETFLILGPFAKGHLLGKHPLIPMVPYCTTFKGCTFGKVAGDINCFVNKWI